MNNLSENKKSEIHCCYCGSTQLFQVDGGIWSCKKCNKHSIFSREGWEEQWKDRINLGGILGSHYEPLNLIEKERKKVTDSIKKEKNIEDSENNVENVESKTPKVKDLKEENIEDNENKVENVESKTPKVKDLKDEEQKIEHLTKKKKSIQVDINQIKTLKISSLFFKNRKNIEARIKGALLNNKHIILIGPPGTGKSKLAKEICELCCGPKGYITATATSDWSTYDTIGGYQLRKDEQMEFSTGMFLQCFSTFESPNNNKWLIIDEINRADIDKAFGSLFSALTGDNVVIPFKTSFGKNFKIIGTPNGEIKKNYFVIPKDWRIIATMNTFDKSSLYEMSYAFMRRFAFIPIGEPKEIDKDLVQEYVENYWNFKVDEEICLNLSELWRIINKKRNIGPAIVKDLYSYIIDTNDYISAIIMYVFPQFEGLSDEDILNFYFALDGLSYIIDIDEELKKFASDYFNIKLERLNPYISENE